MSGEDEWMERAAKAAYALAEIERELASVPTPFNDWLLAIARQGLADLRGVRYER